MANIIDPRIGTEYEGYILEELLGAGGMGAVYRGRHKAIGNLMAIKIVTLPAFFHDKSLQARFVREAMALYALKGIPHIAEIQHVKYDPENPTDSGLIMEYIEGMSFDRYISQEAANNVFTRRQNLGVITNIVGALARVHEKEVIHRDLKPENIMIMEVATGDGKIEIDPKLIDFGICQGAQNEGEEKLTSADNPFGSPLWAAPELFESADEVDHTVDIFSMGLMIYQVFSGEHFYGDVAYTRMSGYLRMNQAIALVQDESRTKKILKKLPREAAQIVKKCIAYKPEKRIQTAKELEEACIEIDALLEKEEKEAIARGEKPPTPEERPKPASQTTPASQTKPFGSRALTVPGPAAVTHKSAETVPATLADVPEAATATAEKAKRGRLEAFGKVLIASICIVVAIAVLMVYITERTPSVSTKPRKAKVETLKSPVKPRASSKAKVAAPKPRPAPPKPRSAPIKARPVPKKPALPKPPSRGRRPSNAYIAHLYKVMDTKCRRTDPRRAVFDRFPHYHLGCIRWYVQKLRNKNRKDFDRVALSVLILDEARAHFCFYKRRRVCGKGKNKKFSAKRPSLINECNKVAYKIGAKRKINSSKLKRLTAMMSGPQAEKISIWMLMRESRRKQIQATWIKSQPSERMLCFKR